MSMKLFRFALVVGACAANPTTVIDLTKAPIVGQTNAEYASWTIDSSYNRGIQFSHPPHIVNPG
jgi:hypothetical protein